MKRIRYELSLDYESGVEKMLSMLDVDSSFTLQVLSAQSAMFWSTSDRKAPRLRRRQRTEKVRFLSPEVKSEQDRKSVV